MLANDALFLSIEQTAGMSILCQTVRMFRKMMYR